MKSDAEEFVLFKECIFPTLFSFLSIFKDFFWETIFVCVLSNYEWFNSKSQDPGLNIRTVVGDAVE